MGLDQYAFARKGEPIRNRLETEYEVEHEIAYWRKHPNLQGWMEQLWREKGGEGEFNCVDVELTLDDLEQQDVLEGVQALRARSRRRADGRLDQLRPGPVVELAVGDAGRAAGGRTAEARVARERLDVVGEQQALVAGLRRGLGGLQGRRVVVASLDHRVSPSRQG